MNKTLLMQQKLKRKRATRAELRFKKALYSYFCISDRAKRKEIKHLFVHQKIFVITNKDVIIDFYLPGYKIVFMVDNLCDDNNIEARSEELRYIVSFLAAKRIMVKQVSYKATLNHTVCKRVIAASIAKSLETVDRPIMPAISREDELEMQRQFILKHGTLKCPSIGANRMMIKGIR